MQPKQSIIFSQSQDDTNAHSNVALLCVILVCHSSGSHLTD